MSPEDREALKWALTAIHDDRDCPRDDYSKAAIQLWLQEGRWEKSITVIRRLLDNDFLTLTDNDCLMLKWAQTALEDVPEIRWPHKVSAVRDIIDRLLKTNSVSIPNTVKNPTVVAVFAEGSFEEIYKSDSPKEAHAFASGVVTGASSYGAGSCVAYVLPDEEADMREHEDAEEIECVLGRIKCLGPLKAVKCDSAQDPTSSGTCNRCGFATEDH